MPHRYRHRIENALQGFYQSTPDGRLLMVNQAFADMLGYHRPEDLLARTTSVQELYVNPRLRDRFRAHLDYHGAARGIEFQMIRKDGRHIWVQVNVRAIRDERGQVLCYEGTAQDVTRNRKLLSQLKGKMAVQNETTRELRRSNSELSQLASVLSHDLREPLRTVRHFLRLLEEEGKNALSPALLEYLHFASEGAGRMGSMVHGLYEYSKAFSKSQPQNVDTQAALESALQNLRSTVLETKADIVIESPLPLVWGCRLQVTQLFQNLVGNALQYRSEAPPRVSITHHTCEPYRLFTVADNGVGFTPEEASDIFSPYCRGKLAAHREGLGLGLSICQKIVETHGGTIWAESVPGHGAYFSFTLPFREAEMAS